MQTVNEWFKYFNTFARYYYTISRIYWLKRERYAAEVEYRICRARFILIREYQWFRTHKKRETMKVQSWASEYRIYLRVIFSGLILAHARPSRALASLARSISVWPMTTTTTRIHMASRVRIFVFGRDHVWIKWQHGSSADADISCPLRGADTNTDALRSSWAHTDRYCVIHTNT